jgi:opacity protein-like surface antigen
MKATLSALVLVGIVGAAAPALALGRGTTMLALELTSSTAEVADASAAGTGYISSYAIPEVGVQGQCWYLMAEDYALAVSGGIGFSNEKHEPGQAAPASAVDETRKSASFVVRLGGDRVVKVGDRALMYGGPGVELWRGKAKYEAATTYEGEPTTRIALSARIGATIVLSDAVGLTAQVGHHIGRASAEENGAKATWWPAGFDGAMGFVFSFGGE